MMKIAPSREKATAIRVEIPKLLIIGKVARQSAENPKNVARPETVMAVPIFWTLSGWRNGMCSRSSSSHTLHDKDGVISRRHTYRHRSRVASDGCMVRRIYIITAFHRNEIDGV